MNKSILIVKTDPAVKAAAQRVAKDIGLSLSAVINAQLIAFAKSREITFHAEPRLNPRYVKELLALKRDADKGKNLSPGFLNMNDAIAWLES